MKVLKTNVAAVVKARKKERLDCGFVSIPVKCNAFSDFGE